MIESMRARSRFVLRLCAVVAFLGTTSAASAQYFGRNKVQYKSFDFQVLTTEHFDIYYYPEAKDGIDIAARLAERWYARLTRVLDHQLRGRQPLILYASHVDFEQTNTIQGELGEGTGGVTEGLRRRIILPLGGPLADTDHVIGHELVHAFQFDMTTVVPAGTIQTGMPQIGAARLPLWFVEGMAEYLSVGAIDANTAMWLRDAVRQDALPTIDDLGDSKYFPYRWGQAFWAYVAGRWGDDVISRMLTLASIYSDPDIAIRRVLGLSAAELSVAWHESMRASYAPVLSSTVPPVEAGTKIIGRARLGGDVNVGPSISPDGSLVAFFSERSLFSVDLFVADAATGKTRHKLTSNATDPHYSSMQFIHSAGGWDAESRRLAVGTVTSGRATLSIFDARSGKRQRELRLAGVDEVFNPTWSPDGSTVAFTGMARGLTDLFTIDLATGTVTQLTRDAFADLQPAWSPDGRSIAFATDRFTTTVETLSIGRYQLARFDVASRSIDAVTGTSGDDITPQWSADSRSLYFVSNRDGIANLYVVGVDGSAPRQLTNFSTGISGITATSPAMSVAYGANVTAFSLYDAGRHEIYTRVIRDMFVAAPRTDASAAVLPPSTKRTSTVQRMLDDPQSTPLPATEYPSAPYETDLSVDAISQPTLAVGANRFGAFAGGGIWASFSDVLGDHTLIAGAQLATGLNGGTSFADTVAQVGYVNRARRWNWGLMGGHVPYLSGGYQVGRSDTPNGPVQTQQAIIFRQAERSASALAVYPLSRARRLEFQGGVTQISFSQTVRTQTFSLVTGRLLNDQTETIALANSMALATTSAAFVSDTSSFGVTSPVQGERFRLEASPTFGTLNMTTVLADYRRYVMPVPFYTIAARVMHYGRYGTGSDDSRLFPFYIGYPGLVRGYNINSLDFSDCRDAMVLTCPAFERLSGSRMVVGNLEFRFPLLRPFTGESRSMYGPWPIELALFADGGVAWSRDSRPALFGGTREGVGSAGIAVRTNVLGFAIGEFAVAKPWQRPGRGWTFQFNLSPGF